MIRLVVDASVAVASALWEKHRRRELDQASACRLVTADRRVYETCRQGALSRLVIWVGEVG